MWSAETNPHESRRGAFRAWIAVGAASLLAVLCLWASLSGQLRTGLELRCFAPAADFSTTPVRRVYGVPVGLAALTANCAEDLSEPFAAEWTGYLFTSVAGRHHFTLASDDGSWLSIDGRPVIDNGGAHAVRRQSGSVDLAAGRHMVSVRYRQEGGGAAFEWLWAPPGGELQPVPSWRLSEFSRNGVMFRSRAWPWLLLAPCVAGLLALTGRQAWRSPRRCIVVAAAAGMLLSSLVVTDLVPSLRGPAPYPDEWQWPYAPRAISLQEASLVVAAILSLAMLGSVAARGLLTASRMRLAAAVGAAVLGTLALQATALSAEARGAASTLAAIVQSDGMTSYFSVAANDHVVPTRRLVTEFPSLMPQLPMHARTHPPGLVLLMRLAIHAEERWAPIQRTVGRWTSLDNMGCGTDRACRTLAAAAFGIALALCTAGALIVVPLYVIGRLAGMSADWSLVAGLLWTVVPALTTFVPQSDQLIALLGTSSAAAFGGAIALPSPRARVASGLAAGLLAASVLMLSFGMAAMLPAGWLVTLVAVGWRKTGIVRRVAAACAVAAMTALALVGAAWASGFDILGALDQGLRFHAELTRTRDWLVWIPFNLVDFAMYGGIPLLAAALARRAENAVVLWAALAVVLALSATGTVRGEVGRIWIPLMPFLTLGIGRALGDQLRRPAVVASLLAIQAGTIVAMTTHWTF